MTTTCDVKRLSEPRLHMTLTKQPPARVDRVDRGKEEQRRHQPATTNIETHPRPVVSARSPARVGSHTEQLKLREESLQSSIRAESSFVDLLGYSHSYTRVDSPLSSLKVMMAGLHDDTQWRLSCIYPGVSPRSTGHFRSAETGRHREPPSHGSEPTPPLVRCLGQSSFTQVYPQIYHLKRILSHRPPDRLTPRSHMS
ncbi:hypothetical protein RRG08_053258 [Elysia crispata]|uniref:Uncharacterized protein n=1 Tax=Elysia crispata TaxID=231223 RepID=A0AAE1E295_9GAST|nr:hypothetical protein RRG08_053258 [Elysia crispata]